MPIRITREVEQHLIAVARQGSERLLDPRRPVVAVQVEILVTVGSVPKLVNVIDVGQDDGPAGQARLADGQIREIALWRLATRVLKTAVGEWGRRSGRRSEKYSRKRGDGQTMLH